MFSALFDNLRFVTTGIDFYLDDHFGLYFLHFDSHHVFYLSLSIDWLNFKLRNLASFFIYFLFFNLILLKMVRKWTENRKLSLICI